MDLCRTFEPFYVNYIANRPDVFKYIKIDGQDRIDLTDFVKDDKNVILEHPHGQFICLGQGGGVYKCHQQFIPHSNSNKIKLAMQGIDYMFTKTDCQLLTGECPEQFKHAALVSRRCGYECVGIKRADWFYHKKHPMLLCFELSKEKYLKGKLSWVPEPQLEPSVE